MLKKKIRLGYRVHPHWMLLCSLMNGMLKSSSAILTYKMQVERRKGAIQGLMAKTRALKMVSRARAVQLALLPVKPTFRSLNSIVNILFARNQAIKLPTTSKKPACSICLGGLAQPKQNKKLLQFPLRETK